MRDEDDSGRSIASNASIRRLTAAFASFSADRRAVLAGAAALSAMALLKPQQTRAAGSPYVTEVAPGAFVHQGIHALYSPENKGNISNPGFVIGTDSIALIDSGGSAIVGQQLRDAIRTLSDRPIRYVINTHMHPDHIFGNAAFKADNPEFVAHHKMARGLSARAERYMSRNKDLLGEEAFKGIEIIMPTKGIDAVTRIDLGGRILELSPQKTAHTDNDLSVRDVSTGTLYLGDLLFAGHVPTIDGSIRGWIAVLDQLAKEPAARVVPGHGPASLAWPDGADPLRHYLNTLATDVRALIKDGKTISDAMASAGRSEKDAWNLFDDYNARNASAAFAELEWE
jgi:quinoprotein relay system zinc metallohydrolase 2